MTNVTPEHAPNLDASVAVVGGGIVGLAAARAIQRATPGRSVIVLEKEPGLAAHQTGHNSGVIHSGIYYPPGSQKAAMVGRGRELLFGLCAEHGIDYELCGKVIVATAPEEIERLRGLEQRAADHGLETTWLDAAGLRAREPHSAGLAALAVPAAGIVSYRQVCAALAAEIIDDGGTVRTGTRVESITEGVDSVTIGTDGGTLRADRIVNCAGLQSDRVARMTDPSVTTAIMPFRGEYYELAPHARHLVRNLIYPVPDPRFPFLGVHFTRMIDGEIHAGPNAVLAMAREGYDWRTWNRHDLAELARNPGPWKLARKYWRTGAGEMHRSVSKRAFVKALRRLVPDVTANDLVRSGAGIRAQAIRTDGTLVDDFHFVDGARSLHVVNAPSPAATASLAIGESIAARLGS